MVKTIERCIHNSLLTPLRSSFVFMAVKKKKRPNGRNVKRCMRNSLLTDTLRVPPAFNEQLKKKKQAAKRKGVAAEEAEPAAQSATAQAVPKQNTAGATDTAVEKKGGGADGQGSPPVPPVGVLEASELAETEVPGVSDGTSEPVSSCTELNNVIGVSVAEDGLPVPPAAPTNGNLRPVVGGSRHKKSVSFGVGEAEMGSILDGLAAGERGVGVMVMPPLPPVGGVGADKSHVVHTNETFLRRNFSLSGDPEQVTM